MLSASRMGSLRVALLSASIALGSCAPAADGATAADFQLRGTRGETLRLSDYTNRKAVVLFFFTTSARSCLPLMPHLAQWRGRYPDALEIIGVAMDGPDSIAEVPAFVGRHGIAVPIALDEDSHVAHVYNPRKADPFFVFIDRAGRVAGVRDGYIVGDEPYIEREIERAMRAK